MIEVNVELDAAKFVGGLRGVEDIKRVIEAIREELGHARFNDLLVDGMAAGELMALHEVLEKAVTK